MGSALATFVVALQFAAILGAKPASEIPLGDDEDDEAEAVPAPEEEAPSKAEAPPKEEKEGDSQELWLLEVHLGNEVVADALPVLARGGHFLVPIGEIARLVGFAIDVDGTHHRASGFVLREDRRFFLDARTGLAEFAGSASVISREQIVEEAGEIYVAADALSRLWPIDLIVDLPSASLIMKPREALPMQLRLQRSRQLGGEMHDVEAEAYPRSDLPYRAWTTPFMDLRAMGNVARNGPDRNVRTDGSYSALLSGDLLFVESTIQAAGSSENPFETKRITLGRRDPEGRLLGPLGAREVALGEISYPGSELVALSTPGTGFLLSNQPLNRPTEYDRHTFRGPLPPGWDVELYQNDALIGYQQSRADGRYEFEVPVFFSLNRFRLVFYGPEGQKREEIHVFNVGQQLTPPGQLRYRIAAAAPDGRGQRTLLGFELGLARNLSAAVDGATVALADGQHAYGKAALVGGWSRVFATSAVVGDARGGWGIENAAQLRLDRLGIAAKRLELFGLHSERIPELFGTIRHRSTLRLEGTLIERPLRIPFAIEGARDDLASGLAVRSLTGQISASYRGFALGQQLIWLEPPPSVGTSIGTGVVRLSKTHFRYAVRSELTYDVKPDLHVTAVALTSEAPLAGGYLASLGFNHATTLGQNRVQGGLHKTAGRFGFGVITSYARSDGVAMSLSVFTGLQRDDSARAWHSAAHPISATGAASALVFFDANDNGKFDPGEKRIEGAAFTVNSGENETRTSRDGTAFLLNMPTYQDTALGLSVASLEDPFWMSRRPGVRISARPGTVAHVEFPIVVGGEVTGTVYLRDDGKSREMSGILLELCDDVGTVRKRARTAYDGFYELSGIPPGHYTLRVEAKQAAKLGVSMPTRHLTFAAEGTILDGTNLVLAAAQ